MNAPEYNGAANQPGPRPLTLASFASTTTTLVTFLLLGVAPVLWIGAHLLDEAVFESTSLPHFFDFHTFYNAGRAVLHGRSPYPPARSSVLAHETSFVYPAPAALLMVPLSLLPFRLAAMLFAVAVVAALPVALAILGVRDWRCYGAALISGPVAISLTLDTLSPLLAIPLALLWRYRDNRKVAAGSLAIAVVLKLFFWPLLVWLVLTRRTRTALSATVLIVLSTLTAWAVLEFHGLRAYPHVLLLLSDLLDGKGYSLVALGRSLGLAAGLARALPWLAGAVLFGAIAILARRPGSDRRTFVLAITAMLALSPIVWLHYFVLLYVAIAISAPRLTGLWLIPLVLFVIPGQSTEQFEWKPQGKQIDEALTSRVGSPTLIIYALVVAAAVLGWSFLSRTGGLDQAPESSSA
jgi:hypothetical protein